MDGVENRLDGREFRRALGQFATGIAVMTTRDGAGRGVGVTVNSFTSVSLAPPLVSFCLDRSALSFANFMAAERFAVNVLAADQQAVSQGFARSIGDDKFAGVDFVDGPCGSPLIADCLVWLLCRRHTLIEAGDHVIVLGEVIEVLPGRQADPLLYFRGQYAHLAS